MVHDQYDQAHVKPSSFELKSICIKYKSLSHIELFERGHLGRIGLEDHSLVDHYAVDSRMSKPSSIKDFKETGPEPDSCIV